MADPGLADTTICLLTKVTSTIPSLPDLGYSLTFGYNDLGRIDSVFADYTDAKFNGVFHYSIDSHPDSITVSFVYPPNNVGYSYRVRFVYDNARRQILSVRDNGDTVRYNYNEHGQLLLRTQKAFVNGEQQSDTSWYYYPNNLTHNYNRIIYRSMSGSLSESAYFFDNHPLPQKFPFDAPFSTGYLSMTDNNVVKGGNAQGGVEYAYTYNEAGYPTEQVLIPGSFAKITYTYHCETLKLP